MKQKGHICQMNSLTNYWKYDSDDDAIKLTMANNVITKNV